MSQCDDPRLPFLSVIVPCFNAEQAALILLNSLACQSLDLSRFEAICVDNGSTDSTRCVIENYACSSSIDLKCVDEFEKAGFFVVVL